MWLQTLPLTPGHNVFVIIFFVIIERTGHPVVLLMVNETTSGCGALAPFLGALGLASAVGLTCTESKFVSRHRSRLWNCQIGSRYHVHGSHATRTGHEGSSTSCNGRYYWNIWIDC